MHATVRGPWGQGTRARDAWQIGQQEAGSCRLTYGAGSELGVWAACEFRQEVLTLSICEMGAAFIVTMTAASHRRQEGLRQLPELCGPLFSGSSFFFL